MIVNKFFSVRLIKIALPFKCPEYVPYPRYASAHVSLTTKIWRADDIYRKEPGKFALLFFHRREKHHDAVFVRYLDNLLDPLNGIKELIPLCKLNSFSRPVIYAHAGNSQAVLLGGSRCTA